MLNTVSNNERDKISSLSSVNLSKSMELMKDRTHKRRKEILEYKRSKILDTNIMDWNKSSKYDIPISDKHRKQMENFVHDRSKNYQYNFRSEGLDSLRNIPHIDKAGRFHVTVQSNQEIENILQSQEKSELYRRTLNSSNLHDHSNQQKTILCQKRTSEMPINPILEGASPWSYSTIPATAKERRHQLESITSKAIISTAKKNQTLNAPISAEALSSSSRIHSIPYVDPVSRQTQLSAAMRQAKREKRAQRSLSSRNNASIGLPMTSTLTDENTGLEMEIYRTGYWMFNSNEKKYIWSDDVSVRPVYKDSISRSDDRNDAISLGTSLATYTD